MEKITKQDMDFLINKLVLKQTHGNYGDNLIVTGKFSSKRGKTRYITTPIYNYLCRLREQETMDMSKIKDNQRYMFSKNNKSVS